LYLWGVKCHNDKKSQRRVLHKWRALGVSVCCDLLALFCRLKADHCRALAADTCRARRTTPSHLHGSGQPPPLELPPAEAAERARRQMTYWYYLLRAPLWRSVTRPAADAVAGGELRCKCARAQSP
jgi:hypothetical protein